MFGWLRRLLRLHIFKILGWNSNDRLHTSKDGCFFLFSFRSLPEYFVVPSSLADQDLKLYSHAFTGRRMPVSVKLMWWAFLSQVSKGRGRREGGERNGGWFDGFVFLLASLHVGITTTKNIRSLVAPFMTGFIKRHTLIKSVSWKGCNQILAVLTP